mgnify:CR=1 FL=1|jgi:hypothetical protein
MKTERKTTEILDNRCEVKITNKNKIGSIECSYISKDDQEHFLISVPSGRFGGISIRLRLDFLTELIEVLQEFKKTIEKEGCEII